MLDAQLVVATAGATLAAGLPDVFAADYLPGEQVAARANLVICNGGSPTSSQAIAQGVPVLAVPGNLDQYLNMHYLEKCGLGLTVRNQNLGDGLLVTAARRMLNNPEFRRNAQRYAEIFRRYDPQARLATAIAKLCPSH